MLDFTAQTRPRPHVNLSALIDVAFILVIFIVLSATFRQERDVEIDLPQTSDTPHNQAEGLQVTVFADGHVQIDGESIPREQVRAVLADKRKEHESVLLVADRGATMQAGVEALTDAQAAGFTSVAMATQRKGSR